MQRKLYTIASILMIFAMLSVNLPGFSTQSKAASNDVPNILINELDADQTSTDAAEFVELYDGGTGNTSLDGLVLVLFNGSGDVSYGAFDLNGYTTSAQGYFVLCGDNANVANCDLDVSPDTNLIQNGPDGIALFVGDATTDFPNGTPVTNTNLIDAVVYGTDDPDATGLMTVLLNSGQPQVNESANGASTTESNQRCPNGSGGARNTDTFNQFNPTPGEENTCVVPVVIGVCGDPATPIHDIQGSGSSSPEAGNMHVVEGVVVGDFQDTGTELGGFFLQEEDADVDSDPLTSEGIFVYDHGFGVDVNPGEVVRALGTVSEYSGLTELGSITGVEVCTEITGTATASDIMLPVTDMADWEPYEDMLVTITQTLYTTGNYTWGRYGEVDLSVNGRLDTPTNVVAPGDDAIALENLNNRSRILLDDGSNVQNPLPLPPYTGDGNTLRAGDTIPGLTGALSYGFSKYRIMPTEPVEFTRVNTREANPKGMGDWIKVSSFNVLNYFTTIDTGDWICGPSGDMECRGADTEEEFIRQREKIITATLRIDADVFGLMEIENNAITSTQDLVTGMNAITGAGTYDFIDTGTIGTDAIKQAIIYKPARVTPVGDYKILDSSVDERFIDTLNRPALAQTFEDNNGERFTVVVNHLKSKGSACDSDPDTGDGQGNCNLTRVAAAQALIDWLATDPTGSGDPDFLIIGDMNSYAMEDPITTLKDAGYTDEINRFLGEGAYSYVYNGEKGYLDHSLASPSLNGHIKDVQVWHINADEGPALDYNNYNQPDLYTTEPYSSSDHDPVITSFDPSWYYTLLPVIDKNAE